MKAVRSLQACMCMFLFVVCYVIKVYELCVWLLIAFTRAEKTAMHTGVLRTVQQG